MRSTRPALVVALLAAAACSREEGGRQAPRADTSPAVSTREMRVGLGRDARQAELDLAALQDSLYLALGDSVAALLRQARASWEQYRKLECDALRLAFAEGTMAPIAQLECWVALSDERRHFLDEQYDFALPSAPPTPARGP